jgi:GTP-binding protein HflX
VGFIADLPPDLVAAFRATLEELADADLLLHVVDAADPRLEQKLESVERLLTELNLAEIPRLLVLNKTDLLEPYEADALARRFNGVAVSAAKRRGLAELVQAAEERLGREKPLMKTYGEEGQGPARAEVV